MTYTLYYQKTAPPPKLALPDGLKFILRERYPHPINVVLSNDLDREFLEGLKAGGVDGAEEVLDFMETHGSVRLFEV